MEGDFSVESWQVPQSVESIRAALDAIEEEHNIGIKREFLGGHPGIGFQTNPRNSPAGTPGKVVSPKAQTVPAASQRPQPVVFYSYATPNRSVVEKVFSWFKAEGLPGWLAPMNPEPGRSYNEEICKAIIASKVVVLILSADAIKSAHVRREVEFAVEKGKIVIPFKVEAVEMPDWLGYLLAGIQHIDATTGPFNGHREGLVNAVWKRLSELGGQERSND